MSGANNQSNNLPINNQDITEQMTGVQLSQDEANRETHQLATQTAPPIPPTSEQQLIPATPLACQKKPNKWPIWDGSIVSFESHILNLRIKIEEDREFLGSNRSICLGIFNSLPVDKQPRVMHWYRTGGPEKTHKWESFLEHIVDQLENKQARQTARNQLQRMRMGSNQLFVDFLQDFELKLSQCDCTHWSDDMKISLLENGINSSLRHFLPSKSLPDDDYLKWISKVKRVSGLLKNTSAYRPQGCSGKRTWYLSQVGAPNNVVIEGSKMGSSPGIDADGDTKMGGMNALKVARAVINTLGGNQLSE
ncbi:hypothetical protein K3495_g14160 [Podosphaera aphanis]|nr:hypothetical protein K3495_g14160 [Podosphaera aphanis]